MKRFALLAIAASLSLTSCGMMRSPDVSGTNRTVAAAAQLNSTTGSGYTAAAGTAVYTDITGGDRRTILTLSGLKANTEYVAHYHDRGAAAAAGTSDCASNGPVVGGEIARGTSSATGTLELRGFQSTAALQTADYINVHEAAALSVVPLCVDI